MQLGVAGRSMGSQSAPEVVLTCVWAAEPTALADFGIQDHVAALRGGVTRLAADARYSTADEFARQAEFLAA